MKIKLFITLLVLALSFTKASAQTIAVSEFSTSGLHATPEIVAKLARLELIKTNKHVVMDESDMSELLSPNDMDNCYGKNCLIALGQKLKVPLILGGSVDGIGGKIVITVKLIDVKTKSIKDSRSMEFDNQEIELQRMLGIIIQEMHDIQPNEEVKKQLSFRNEVIISENVSKINNSGPRMGLAYIHEGTELSQFFNRDVSEGGIDIIPITTNLGYQFEGQYIGTENFSALAELIFNVSGMEQGQFLPSLTLLNGFRFGAQGWEFAFGPSFGFRRESRGFFSEQGKNLFGREEGRYWSSGDFYAQGYTNETLESENYTFTQNLDKRGDVKINTNWLMAVGRTFKAGALNIPFNVYYSYNKFGGTIGTSVGFNVTKNKSRVN